jgi:hypothetical protein
MAIWVSAGTHGDFRPPPEGLHSAVCVDVEDLGIRTGQYGPKHEVRIVWQLDLLDPESKKRFIVSAWFTLSLADKSKLRPFLEAWRGKKFTASELNQFDLESVIGANCQLQIIHTIKPDGKTSSKVQAAVPMRPSDQKLHALDYTRMKDRPTEKNTGGHSETNAPEPF